MHENIGVAIIRQDEAKSAIRVEELHPASWHDNNPVQRTVSAPDRRSRKAGEGRRNYLARRHTDSAFVPVEVVGFVYRSSSAVSEVMMRFCSPPMRFGYELPSMRVVSVLSASLT